MAIKIPSPQAAELAEEELAWGSRRADAYEKEIEHRSAVVAVRRAQQLMRQKRLVLDGLDERPRRRFGEGWDIPGLTR